MCEVLALRAMTFRTDRRPMGRVRRVCRRSLPSLTDRRVDMLEELRAANSASYVCVVSEGSHFRAPWVLKLSTRASPSKVNKIDTTEQLIEDGVICLSEKESEGA